jgi:protease PrsW
MRTRSFVATGWLNVAAQAGLLGLLYAFGRDRSLDSVGLPREIALLVLVGVPSAIWTAFFYLRDRRRPEPSRYVLAAFLAGMAAAAVFALPVERDLFHTSEWLYRSTASLLLGSVLIRGTLASFLLYLVIRVGFYPSREFDEPVDGLVYGAFAGSGFAAVTSLTYLVGRGDFTVFAIGYTAATQILMYATIGALVGYAVGRTKFDRAPSQRSHVAGVLAGAVLTGLYHTAAELAFTTGAPHALWLSFALTLALSIVVLAGASILIARLRGRHVADVTGTATGRGAWVWACALALLLAGGLAMHVERGDATVASATPAIRFRYSPSTLSPRALAPAPSTVSPLVPVLWSGTGDEGGPFAVTVAARPERVALPALDALAYVATPAPIDLTLEPVTIGGRAGMRARYAHLETGRDGQGSLPEMVWTYTDVVPGADYTFVFTLEGRPAGFPRQERVYRRLLDSVQWPAP